MSQAPNTGWPPTDTVCPSLNPELRKGGVLKEVKTFGTRLVAHSGSFGVRPPLLPNVDRTRADTSPFFTV